MIKRLEKVPRPVDVILPPLAVVKKKLVEEAVVEKKLVVVALVEVELRAVKLRRVVEPVKRRLEAVVRPSSVMAKTVVEALFTTWKAVEVEVVPRPQRVNLALEYMVEVPIPMYRAPFGMMAREFEVVVAHLEFGVVWVAQARPVEVT